MFLEEQLQRYLKRTGSIVPIAVFRGADVTESRRVVVQLTRLRERRRVRHVESFRAELETERISNLEILEDCRIQVFVSGPASLFLASAKR